MQFNLCSTEKKTTSENVNNTGPMVVVKNFLIQFFKTAQTFEQNETNRSFMKESKCQRIS